jgi:RNA 2',3'-cyclic 3'-phosphodiesterase
MADARLFFALWPDDAMQAALATSVSAIVREVSTASERSGLVSLGDDATKAASASRARPVPAKNFHLTLAFLGAVPGDRVDALSQVGAQCAQAFAAREGAIDLTLDTVEHWREPQILCATSRRNPEGAAVLSETLKSALAAAGFVTDLKPFRAHATLARKVHRVTCELRIAPVRWRFTHLHLIESKSGPDGSAYSALKKWALYKPDR